MSKEQYWFIPCELNRASLGDSDVKFVILTKLHRHPNFPIHAPVGTVWLEEQEVAGTRLKGYVLVRESDRRGNIVVVEGLNDGKQMSFEIHKNNILTLNPTPGTVKAWKAGERVYALTD